MAQRTTSATAPSALQLTDDQVRALALHIGSAFPPWRVWWAADIWYATGPCRLPECVCSRTLHAPRPADLCRQLEAAEQAGREQREDRDLTIGEAYLLLAGLSWSQAGPS